MSRAAEIDWFGVRPANRNLRQQAIRGGAMTLAAKVAMGVLRLGSMLIFARVLAPADFGVVAMAMAVIGIGHLFRDMGLSAATVQRHEITASQVNTLFWLNSGLGGLMTLLAAISAPFLASFYADERLFGATLLLSLSFLVNSLGTQHLALLRRNLRLGLVARINVVSVLLSISIGLAMALQGFGHWSLVAVALTADCVLTIAAWLACTWRPGRPAWDPSVRAMLNFAGFLVAFSLLAYLARSLPTFLLGKLQGAAAVGVYTRAFRVTMKLAGYITEPPRIVAISVLARLQDQPERFRSYYLRGIRLMMLAAAPASAYIFLSGDDLILLLLGDQWTETGALLRWFALALVPQVLGNSTGWIYMALGRSKQMMWWGICGWTAMLIGFLIGARHGTTGFAIAYAASIFATFLPALWAGFRNTHIRLRDAFEAVWRPVIAALAALLVLLVTQGETAAWSLFLRVPVDAMVFGTAYSLIVLGALRQWPFIADILREFRQRRHGSTS